MTTRDSTEHFALGTKIALEAIKSLLLVNGGAATALIALTTKGSASANYAISIILFGCAALLNVVTMIFGYLSQLSYANHCLDSEKDARDEAKMHLNRHQYMQYSAFAVVLISLILSAVGMVSAFNAAR